MASVDTPLSPRRWTTWFLLFAGFSSIVGWIATSGLLLTRYANSRHFATVVAALRTIGGSLLHTSFFLVAAAVFLPCGLRRLRRTEAQAREDLVLTSLCPSILLFPVLMYVGIGIIMVAPFCLAHVRVAVLGPRIVQSVISPDGNCEAYVVDRPSIDGPNHHLYVRHHRRQAVEVAALPEDVDFNKAIYWSPRGDVVVFQTHFSLIGYRVADGRRAEVSLGGERHWRKNGTFWVDYDAAERVGRITFPEAGSFHYYLEGAGVSEEVRFAADEG